MRATKLLNGSARLYPALKWFWVVVVVGLVLGYLSSFIYAIVTGGNWEPTTRTWRFLGNFGGVIALVFIALALLTLQAWSSHRRQIDPILLGAAKIIKSSDIQIGRDIVVQGFRPDVELERTVERLARTALHEREGVVIIGRPKSGKTRLAVKLVQELPNATVIIPRTDEPPLSFGGLALQGRDLILLCDDLHQNAETFKPLLWKQHLEEASGEHCSVICTARDGKEWQRVERSQGALLDAIGRDAVYAYTSRVEAVGEDVSPEQARELAGALGIAEDDLLRRFDGTPGSLTLDLADMRRRYRMLQDEVVGSIGMGRLLDSAKLLFAARQTRLREPMLRTVAENIRGSGRMADEAWDALRRRTEQEGFGWFEEGAFIIYGPYLEQCVAYEPSTDDLEALLSVLADAGDAEGMFYLGVSLQETSPVVAEEANRAAAAAGIPAAFNNLGFVLVQQGRFEEAEEALRVAVQAGISDAFVQLGRLLLGQPGREDEAEEVFRAAVRAGFPEGYRNLGFFFSTQGRVTEAEQVYREALAVGDTSVWFSLGHLLFEQGGREDEAVHAYRRAAEYGDIGARNNLGNLLMEQGRLDEAEQHFAIAIANGSSAARNNLGKLRIKQGRVHEADQEFRAAIASGDTTAYYNLAVTLAQLGRNDEAEHTYREAIGVGVDHAWFGLGNLLSNQPGREADAIEALRMASQKGVEGASNNLGILLAKQRGQDEAAIQAYRSAIEAGNKKALRNLGLILTRDPNRRLEAEEVFRKAINAGVEGSWCSLGDLLSNQIGREQKAEEAYRVAIDEGDVRAYGNLGTLLERQGKDTDAEQVYRLGAEAGSVEAAHNLALLLADEPERQDESERISQDLIDAGKADGFNSLGVLRAMQGRIGDAEAAFQASIAGGDTSAYMNLGIMLAGLPGRQEEAERALRAGIVAGHLRAYYHLGILLARQRGREAEAKRALESAVAAGVGEAASLLNTRRSSP